MKRWSWRLLAWGVGVGLLLGVTQVHAQVQERLAQGLIVKLKDAQAGSVVRLSALSQPQGSAQALRMRLNAASLRAKVSYLQARPTAFGATVLSKGYYTTMAQAEAEAAKLRQDSDVEWVVVNEMLKPAAAVTEDPMLDQQYWMSNSDAGGTPNIPAALTKVASASLAQVVVAVLDTGVLAHPDFDGRVMRGHDFVSDALLSNDGDGLDSDPTDPGDYLLESTLNANRSTLSQACGAGVAAHLSSWHGTATTGILAAGRNAVGIRGMLAPLPGSPVMAVRVGGACGAALSDIVEGLLWSAGIDYHGTPPANPYPARVINLSYGSQELGCTCADKRKLSGQDSVACLYQNTVDALTQKGALLVASAGNGNEDIDNPTGYGQATMPAACPGVLAVTSVRGSDALKANYANATPTDASHFAVATMGGDDEDGRRILTTSNPGDTTAEPYASGVDFPGYGDYANAKGTSMASPIAAGAAALMLAVNPGLSVSELLAGLTQHGVRRFADVDLTNPERCGYFNPRTAIRNYVQCRCTTSTCGSGVLDVSLAVEWALANKKPGSFSSPYVAASFFVPNRGVSAGSSQQRPSSGGGGAVDLGLLALVLLGLAFSGMASRRA